MKKYLVLLLMFALLLAGCSGGKSTSSNSGSEGAKELTFWSFETEKREQIQKSVEEFNASHKDIQIKAEFIDNEAFKTKMKVAIAGNKLPDIFPYWSGATFETLVDAGVVGDLTEHLDQDTEFKNKVLPGGLETFSYDGKTYGIPLTLSSVQLWYNKEIFEKNGLTPPKTYDELLEVVDKLNTKNITPITVSGKDRWPVLHWYSYLAHRIGGNEPFEKAKNGEIDFTEASFVDAGQKLKELAIEKKGFVNGFLGIDNSAAGSVFMSGKAAMYLQGDWALADFVKDEKFTKKVGFVPFPKIEGGNDDEHIFHGGFGFGYAISAKADQKAAYEAIKFLSSAEQRQEITEAGTPSAMKDVELDQSKMNPLVYEYLTYVGENAKGFFGYYDQQLDPKRADQFLNVTSAIVGKPDVDVKKELGTIVK
ncbi:raffinose/stachyose/melibiose transport system substrate-binding protein [Bacillus fengqiuensis]|nr:raffinose/stachyose/melibiose transport system substrate-binding protein [Bacillus fengqiuensis]